jgi:CHU_C Type IX secretion signal domain
MERTMESKDDLTSLLQERFSGHEVAVSDEVWDAIGSQMLLHNAAPDTVNDLFKERFEHHTAEVDPSAWQHISGRLGHAPATLGAGGWFAVGAGALVLAGIISWATGVETTTVTDANRQPQPRTQQTEKPQPVLVPAPIQAPIATGLDKAPMVQTSAAIRPTLAAPLVPSPKQAPDLAHGTRSTAHADEAPEREALVEQILHALEAKVQAHPQATQTETVPGVGVLLGREAETEASSETSPELGEQQSKSSLVARIWVPNVFTPGMQDGVNDDLVVTSEEPLTNISVRVYSLANALVFQANDLRPWNGQDLGGQPCPAGFYFYALEAQDEQGAPLARTQVVNLLR